MESQKTGARLVELCRSGKNLEAIDTLCSPKIVSIEAMGNPQMPVEMKGIEAIRGKNQWWFDNHEIHSATVEGPFPNKNRFAVVFAFDVTPKSGPMKGKRMKMKEVGLYTVDKGKITREEFYYDM